MVALAVAECRTICFVGVMRRFETFLINIGKLFPSWMICWGGIWKERAEEEDEEGGTEVEFSKLNFSS